MKIEITWREFHRSFSSSDIGIKLQVDESFAFNALAQTSDVFKIALGPYYSFKAQILLSNQVTKKLKVIGKPLSDLSEQLLGLIFIGLRKQVYLSYLELANIAVGAKILILN